MKFVSRKVAVSVLLLMVAYLSLAQISPSSIGSEPTNIPPTLTYLSSTFYLPTISSTGHFTFSRLPTMTNPLFETTTSRGGITWTQKGSATWFLYSLTVSSWNTGECQPGFTPPCVIYIESNPNYAPPGHTLAGQCCQASVTISVNFPSNEEPEPVTVTVSGLPAQSTFSWGNEQPASSLAPYTAMPPYSVNLGIYTTTSTPLYGTNMSPDTITITATSQHNFPQYATITLNVTWQTYTTHT